MPLSLNVHYEIMLSLLDNIYFRNRADSPQGYVRALEFESTHPLPTPLASFPNGIGCTLLQHPTSHALFTFPSPRQRELACWACISTAQVGASLAAP